MSECGLQALPLLLVVFFLSAMLGAWLGERGKR